MLQIKKYPDPILRKRAEEVKEITPEIKDIILDMLETMITKQGMGIAASQIGALKKIIVVKTEKGPEVFLNPKILKKSRKKVIMEEGCLSIPGLWLKIKRTKGIEVEALNEEGERNRVKAEGVIARVFQHEIDHLNGVLFIDRLNFWQRFKLRKKLKQLK